MKIKTTLFIALVAFFGCTLAFAEDSTAIQKPKSPKAKHHAVKKANSINNVSYSSVSYRTQTLENEVQSLKEQVKTLQDAQQMTTSGTPYMKTLVEMYAHGPAVVTSPALGVRRAAEDASDLMVSLPSVNEDLQLLDIRKRMEDYAMSNNIPIPERPIIALSGGVEGQGIYAENFNNNRSDGMFDLSRAEFDLVGEASPWATAVMIFTYDNNRVANLPLVTNSRVQISRGFVTLGDLNKFPMYLTVGQMYVPFGNYGSYMVNNPPTYYLAKTKERAALLGFAKYGIYASVYGYKGEVTTFKTQDASRYLGVNVGYKFSKDKFSADVVFGYIGDIAESAGMQSVFTNAAYGVNDALQHTVGGASARVKLGLDRFTLIGEYESAVRSFAGQDMTFNHKGAVPKALETELVYSFPILGKPNNIGIGYGRSWESLALSIPEQDYFAVFSTSIFRSTIESIEFRHDINYKSTDTSSVGQCVIPSTPRRGRNVVTAQIGIYF